MLHYFVKAAGSRSFLALCGVKCPDMLATLKKEKVGCPECKKAMQKPLTELFKKLAS